MEDDIVSEFGKTAFEKAADEGITFPHST